MWRNPCAASSSLLLGRLLSSRRVESRDEDDRVVCLKASRMSERINISHFSQYEEARVVYV